MKMYELEFSQKEQNHGTVYTFFFLPLEDVEYFGGQWVHLMVGEGREMVRHMSFASSPHEKFISFTADVKSGSPFKKQLMSLTKGQKSFLFKIRTSFEEAEYAEKGIVCVVGGVGAAPARSVLVDAAHRSIAKNSALIQVSRDHYIYEQELSSLPFKQVRISSDFLREELTRQVSDSPRALFYLAGSEGFIEASRSHLERAGLETEQIRSDVFTGYQE